MIDYTWRLRSSMMLRRHPDMRDGFAIALQGALCRITDNIETPSGTWVRLTASMSNTREPGVEESGWVQAKLLTGPDAPHLNRVGE